MSNKSAVWDKVPFLQKLKNIKHIELIIIGLFVMVLAVIYFSSTNTENSQTTISAEGSLEEYCDYLEAKLTRVIQSIDGAGKTSVMITFDGRITYEYAFESEQTTTTSSVTSGTNSKTVINEKIIMVTQDGKSVPLVVREVYPEIAGVVVVASGANGVAVKLNIISAVKTLLGVGDNKIQVLTGSV